MADDTGDRDRFLRLGFQAGWAGGWAAAMLRVADELEAAGAPDPLSQRFREWAEEPDATVLTVHDDDPGVKA